MLFRYERYFSLNIGSPFVEDFSFCHFDGVAINFGHGFWITDNHAGGTSQDFADGPCFVFVREEDLSDALLFWTVVPAT